MKAKILITTAIAFWLMASVTGQTPVSKDFAQRFPFSVSERAKAAHLQQKGVAAARIANHSPEKMMAKSLFSGWRLDSLLSLFYDSGTSTWVNSFKAIHQYDALFRSTQYTDYLFDDILGQWVPSSREIYTFTPQGDISTQIFSNWDDMMNQFVNSIRDEYTYAPTGELTMRISSDWNFQTSQWDPYSRMEYDYDSLGRLDEVLFYFWDEYTLVWIKGMLEQYDYNVSGQLVSITSDYWIDYQQLWFPGSLREFTYHTSGLVATDMYSYWDVPTNQYIPSDKSEYTYNAAGNNTVTVSSWYDDMTSTWYYQWKDEKTWNASGNLTVWTGLAWDDIAMQWVPDNRQTMTYDNAWPNGSLAIPYQYMQESGEFFNHMLTEMNGEYYNGVTWEDAQKASLFWSPHNLIGVEEVAEPTFMLYPNPAGSVLNIRTTGYNGDVLFELFDLTGRRVAEEITPANSRVNLAHLNNGVYVARISSAAGVMHQGKVIVKN